MISQLVPLAAALITWSTLLLETVYSVLLFTLTAAPAPQLELVLNAALASSLTPLENVQSVQPSMVLTAARAQL